MKDIIRAQLFVKVVKLERTNRFVSYILPLHSQPSVFGETGGDDAFLNESLFQS